MDPQASPSVRNTICNPCRVLALVACLALAGCMAEVGGRDEPLDGEGELERGTQSVRRVAGHSLTSRQEHWVRYVARHVVPGATLYFGSRDRALTRVAGVTWWSLKEGIMELGDPLAYSNCHYPDGDRHIGAMSSCPYSTWQVGLAGVQVKYTSMSTFEAIARKAFPGASIDDVLRQTARDAGRSPGAVAAATGDLRRSWLARNATVGFIREWDYVAPECISGSRSWCHGSWYPSSRFAPNRSVARRARADLRAILASTSCPLEPGGQHELFMDMPPGSFGHDAAVRLYHAGVTHGCRDSSSCRAFCPDAAVTREQMAAFLARAAGLPMPSSPRTFSDVPAGSMFHAAIAKIAAAGITHGCGGDRFCPGDPVTREQMAAFLVRARKWSPLSSPQHPFTDVPRSNIFFGAIHRLRRKGVTRGCGSNSYCPKDHVTRAQMAIFLMRTFGL